MIAHFLSTLGMSPSLAWFVLGFILLIFEVLTPSALIFFFGFGAWTVSLVVGFVEISTNVQLIIFLISSLIYLALLRGVVLGYIERKMSEESDVIEDEFVGKQVIVVQAICPPVNGKVSLNGTNWNASADQELTEGQPAIIIARNNITLQVQALK